MQRMLERVIVDRFRKEKHSDIYFLNELKFIDVEIILLSIVASI